MQKEFREECLRLGIWSGGKVATQQDMSAYFFVRSVELYLKDTGTIAFVMPYAALSRKQFEGFRTGQYGRRRGSRVEEIAAVTQFTGIWAFDDKVQPLFPVPSCVIFARKVGAGSTTSWPDAVLAYRGELPRRDASPAEADEALKSSTVLRSVLSQESTQSPYRDVFSNGATVFPRMLFVVDRVQEGVLGSNPAAPLVQSRRTKQEKPPWKNLPDLRGNVEAQFLRRLYLGESIAPFRVLDHVESVIPWDSTAKRLLNSNDAQNSGYIQLGQWLRRAETQWDTHGKGNMTLNEQLDFYGKLTAQMPLPKFRVVYAASGSNPAATILEDDTTLVEHALYYATISNRREGQYLCAILNSETARSRIEAEQAKGQWGARHFDKVIFALPIPRFDSSDRLHRQLEQAAKQAEKVATQVPLKDGLYFVTARRQIREALAEDGIAQRIDRLVAKLLDA